ncbi:hypothetical protein B194_3798 [Serratia plymuthica A30]|nr:hypothetical protein B194_3798 [Serratia plymuthica A30]
MEITNKNRRLLKNGKRFVIHCWFFVKQISFLIPILKYLKNKVATY